MALAHPENEKLLAALRERDAPAVGPALLEATLLVPATQSSAGETEPAAQRNPDGSLELVAFTSPGNLRQWRAEIEHAAQIHGGDLVNLAVRLNATTLRLDPGQEHSGFLGREALVHLSGQLRSAGPAKFDPAGEWATDEIAEGIRQAVQADDELSGAWMADRNGRPSVLLDIAAQDPAPVINRVIERLRPVVGQGTRIDFVVLNDSRRAEAEALGEPLA